MQTWVVLALVFVGFAYANMPPVDNGPPPCEDNAAYHDNCVEKQEDICDPDDETAVYWANAYCRRTCMYCAYSRRANEMINMLVSKNVAMRRKELKEKRELGLETELVRDARWCPDADAPNLCNVCKGRGAGDLSCQSVCGKYDSCDSCDNCSVAKRNNVLRELLKRLLE